MFLAVRIHQLLATGGPRILRSGWSPGTYSFLDSRRHSHYGVLSSHFLGGGFVTASAIYQPSSRKTTVHSEILQVAVVLIYAYILSMQNNGTLCVMHAKMEALNKVTSLMLSLSFSLSPSPTFRGWTGSQRSLGCLSVLALQHHLQFN